MINVSSTNISDFKNLIGCGIKYFSSSQLAIYNKQEYAVTHTRELIIGFIDKGVNNLFLSAGAKGAYFDNSEGDCYYDYTIQRNMTKGEHGNATLFLETSPIIKIEVFGRQFDINSFGYIPKNNNNLSEIHETDDVFLFKCKLDEQILIAFHPILPIIEVYFTSHGVKRFFNEHADLYRSHHILTM